MADVWPAGGSRPYHGGAGRGGTPGEREHAGRAGGRRPDGRYCGALVSGESNDYDPTALVEDGVIVAIMKGYWTNFAKRGFPAFFWPVFNSATQQMRSLVPPAPRTETDFASSHNRAFWTALEAG
jgi:hypothetical protein